MIERTNQEWLDALHGPGRDEALADLRAILVRGLSYALAGSSDVDDSLLEDFAQEALLKVLNGLDSFRGESRFTTWAQEIAVRVALTELRRHRWRDVSLDEMTGSLDVNFIPDTLADPSAGPEQQAMQHMLLSTLRRIIATELTDKQRQALVGSHSHSRHAIGGSGLPDGHQPQCPLQAPARRATAAQEADDGRRVIPPRYVGRL